MTRRKLLQLAGVAGTPFATRNLPASRIDPLSLAMPRLYRGAVVAVEHPDSLLEYIQIAGGFGLGEADERQNLLRARR